jgi:hypothetical protein
MTLILIASVAASSVESNAVDHLVVQQGQTPITKPETNTVKLILFAETRNEAAPSINAAYVASVTVTQAARK